MGTRERIAVMIGSVGAAVVVGHVVLGREIVPPVGAFIGAIVAAIGLGAYLLMSRRAGSAG